MVKIITCRDHEDQLLPMKEIGEIYQRGGLIVYPTETLYGIGVDPLNENALDKLYTVKQRPRDMPVSVAVSDITMMKEFGEMNSSAERIAEHLLPGPVTLLLKTLDDVPRTLTKNNKIGLRIPNHPVTLGIIKKTGPLTATSANIHGELEPYIIMEAINQLGDGVDIYIDCGESKFKGPSTIVDCSETSISIIRKGVIPEKEIRVLFD
jgi:L-threonylcarbamoyladenylate synthase